MSLAHRIEAGTLAAAPLLAMSLLGAAPAFAAAPWSAPQTIGVTAGHPQGIARPIPGGTAASAQQLLALPGGGIALAADTNLYLVQHPGAAATFVAPEGLTGEISPDGVLGRLAPVGGGRTASALLAAGGSRIRALGTSGVDQTLSSASGRPGQALKASTTLKIPSGSVVATTSNAILVRRCSRDCVRTDLAVVRRQGARWTAPRRITIAGTEVRGGAITTLPHGVIAVAFEKNHAIYVRTLTPHGRLSPAQRIGTGVQSEISIVSTGGDRLAVAWSWQRVDEGDATSPFQAQVACSTGAGHFTGRSHALASIPVTGTGSYVSGAGMSIGKDGGGAITLAWTGYERDRFVVRTSSLSTRCATSTETIALPGTDAILGALAVAPSGRATIAIIAGRRGADAPLTSSAVTETGHGIFAAQRATSTVRFTTAVQVSASDDNEVEPVLAIDQTNGRSVLAWRNVATSIQYATAPRTTPGRSPTGPGQTSLRPRAG